MDELTLFRQRKTAELKILENLLNLLKKDSQQIPDDVFRSFLSIYADTFKKALFFIDSKSVYYMYTQQNKDIGLFLIGNDPAQMLWPNLFYCACPKFQKLFEKNEPSVCAHLLARDIGWTLGGKYIEMVQVTDEHLSNTQYEFLSDG